jgi:hypothetical protein
MTGNRGNVGVGWQDVASRTVEEDQLIPFLCECADDACAGRTR